MIDLLKIEMKAFLLQKKIWFLLLFLFTHLVYSQAIPERPTPARFVNDYVGMLSGNEKSQLESKLKAYMDSTSNQIVIVVVKSTGDYPPGDYAFQIGRQWGIGQKDKNNGIVLLWVTETRKIYIAVGYGLEGAVPDGIAKRIVSNQIVPAFKQQQWFQGLDAATTELIQRASGEFKSDQSDLSNAEDDPSPMSVLIVMIILIVGIFLFIRLMGNSCRNSGGNRGGAIPWVGPYTTMSSWGSSSGGWSSGSSSGGGWSFGGGSFGGGGAGGDY
ncbi:MAG: TPM domain-containing protein [Siphonobacter sp.]